MAFRVEVERLLQIVKNTLLTGEFPLSSGSKSPIYFDGFLATLNPEGACLIGKLFFKILIASKVEAVGGPTIAADPIATAIAVISHQQRNPIPAFLVRREKKSYGTEKQIEGPLKDGSLVAIVDSVITTGKSIIDAISVVEARGCKVVLVVVLIDRQQGGSFELKRRGYNFQALFRSDPSGEIHINV